MGTKVLDQLYALRLAIENINSYNISLQELIDKKNDNIEEIEDNNSEIETLQSRNTKDSIEKDIKEYMKNQLKDSSISNIEQENSKLKKAIAKLEKESLDSGIIKKAFIISFIVCFVLGCLLGGFIGGLIGGIFLTPVTLLIEYLGWKGSKSSQISEKENIINNNEDKIDNIRKSILERSKDYARLEISKEFQRREDRKETIRKENILIEEQNKELTEKIERLELERNNFVIIIKEKFNKTLYYDEWENIDYIIYCFESGRADTIKEALTALDLDTIKRTINITSDKIIQRVTESISEFQHTSNTQINMLAKLMALGQARAEKQLNNLGMAVIHSSKSITEEMKSLSNQIDYQMAVTQNLQRIQSMQLQRISWDNWVNKNTLNAIKDENQSFHNYQRNVIENKLLN